MTKTVEISCDGCGEDLRYTGYEYAYRLALTPEAQAHRGGAVFSMGRGPDIDSEKHFCDIRCLDAWLKLTFPALSPVGEPPTPKEQQQ